MKYKLHAMHSKPHFILVNSVAKLEIKKHALHFMFHLSSLFQCFLLLQSLKMAT